jgi:hypothetical protein
MRSPVDHRHKKPAQGAAEMWDYSSLVLPTQIV